MNVLVATDGSKYGQWGLNWVATLPFVKPPRVTALHVLDSAAFRGPFRTRLEIQRVEAHSATNPQEGQAAVGVAETQGHGPQGARGGRTGDLETRAQTGRAPGGGQSGPRRPRPLHARQRVDETHPACDLSGACRQGRGGTVAADHLGDRWVARIGQSTGVCADQVSAGSFNRQGRAGADSCERDPCDGAKLFGPHHDQSTIPWIKSPELKEANLKLIDQSVRKLIKAGFTAEPLYQLGKPAEEIMKVAAKQHADLIVMGAKGLGAIDRFLLGSVSTRVVQHANCAVLVVR